jgi:hypothetical protein
MPRRTRRCGRTSSDSDGRLPAAELLECVDSGGTEQVCVRLRDIGERVVFALVDQVGEMFGELVGVQVDQPRLSRRMRWGESCDNSSHLCKPLTRAFKDRVVMSD